MTLPRKNGLKAKISVHTTYKKLAGGRFGIYAYAFKGGPRLCDAKGNSTAEAKRKLEQLLGSPEILKRYVELTDTNIKTVSAKGRTIFHAVPAFFDSAEFDILAKSTKRDYRRYLNSFREEFQDYTVAAFENFRINDDIYEWRENWRGKNAAADYAVKSVSVFFRWMRMRHWTNARPTEGIPNLYKSDRAEVIWTEEDLQRFSQHASKEVADVVWIAALTGLRLIDVLRLPWSAIGQRVIQLTSTKRKKIEVKPVLNDLRDYLGGIPQNSPIVLLNKHGKPWTTDGFGTSFDRARRRAGLDHLMFRDTRGTACTRFFLAGIRNPHTLARLFGWELSSVQKLIGVYVSPDALNADVAEWAELNADLDMAGRMKQKPGFTNR